MTSVDPRCPRWRQFSAAIRRSDTNVTESCASRTRAARSTDSTARCTRARATGMRTCSVATWTTCVTVLVAILRVRLDDVTHHAMAHDVDVREVVKCDAIDAGEDALNLHQPRLLALRQIDLRLVGGDDDLRAHAGTR